MRRLLPLVAASVVFLALLRPAAAAPCTTCGAEVPSDGSAGPTRALWVTWATTVNVVFTAADLFEEARTGHRNYNVTGLQFVASLPVLLYGIDFMRADPHDAVAWNLTVWSGVLVAHGVWPIVQRKLLKRRVDSKKPAAAQLAPTTIVGWADDMPHAGLSFSATF